VFLEQQKRRKQSILSNVFQPLRQVFQQRKAVYALITISAFIIGISAVLLLAVPGLSGPLTGSVLGEETITWILIVISCISTLILLLLILLKK
jgi:Flp pilus assembly protein TadB